MTYLRDALVERAGEFIQLRRDIHHHPELAFEEHRTANLVAAKLESWGYTVHRGLGGTGVVGTLKIGDSHRSLGIRADMDALPIQEATGAAWASSKPGIMHACGHDGHTTILIGADGRVKLYETGAIANANVTFDATVKAELEALTAGRVVTREAYLAAVAAAPPPAAAPRSDAVVLTGRALRIAQAMPCPCGCDDQVVACNCKTADGIKAKLAAGDFGDKTDAQIMEALNQEFCMKGM